MLNHLKIVDASSVLAGPSVGMFFAELGARVIKIEHPDFGDVTRSWKLSQEDKNSNVSAYFSSVNYKKEYLSLNYSKAEDRQRFLDEVKDATILLSNFKLGDAEKFNLTDDVLFDINPTLIHGKISGFGSQSDRVAYDLILQAETGFMSMNGTPESEPVKMPVALIDVLAAHHLKEGILLALLQKNNVNKAQVVEVSLFDAAISSLVNQATNYLNVGHVPQRIGSLHPNIAPYGELFETKDHQLITFAIGSDRHFEKLCRYLSLDELITNELYTTNVARVANRTTLYQLLQNKISQVNSVDLLHEMHKNYVPVGKIKSLDEVLDAPEIRQKVLEEVIDSTLTKRLSSIAFKIT